MGSHSEGSSLEERSVWHVCSLVECMVLPRWDRAGVEKPVLWAGDSSSHSNLAETSKNITEIITISTGLSTS